jgi:hypothetical protein
MKLHHAFAGITAIFVTGHNNLLSTAPQPLAASSSMTGLVNGIS